MELRRTTPAAVVPLWRRFCDANGLGLLLLGGLFFVVAALLDIWPVNPIRHREGTYVTEDIYARVNFSMLDENALPRREQEIKLTTPAVFTLDTERVELLYTALKTFPDTIDSFQALTQPSSLPANVKDPWLIKDEAVLDAWRSVVANRRPYDNALEQLRQKLVNTPIVNPEAAEQQGRRPTGSTIILMRTGDAGDSETRLPANQVIAHNAPAFATLVDSWLTDFDEAIRPGILKQVLQKLSEPIYVYDDVTTQQLIGQAIEKLHANPPRITRNQGDLLVARNHVIDARQFRFLEAEHDQWRADKMNTKPHHIVTQVAGRCGVVLLITVLMFAYLFRYERDLLRDYGRGLAAVLIMLGVLALNKIVMFSAWNERVAVLTVMLVMLRRRQTQTPHSPQDVGRDTVQPEAQDVAGRSTAVP